MIATGSTAAMPPIDGLGAVGAWSNREITTAKDGAELPADPRRRRRRRRDGGRLELSRNRSDADRGSRSDPDPRGALRRRAGGGVTDGEGRDDPDRRQGGRRRARRGRDDQISVVLDDGGRLRGPAPARRGRAEAERRRHRARDGGRRDRGQVDRGRRSDAGRGRDWLYAIGDVNGRSLLTHMGKYQARVAAENILGRDLVASRTTNGHRERSSPTRRWRRSATRSRAPRRRAST